MVSCRLSFSINVPSQWFVLGTGIGVWYFSKIVDLAEIFVELLCISTWGRIKEKGIWLSNLFFQVQELKVEKMIKLAYEPSLFFSEHVAIEYIAWRD